MSDATPPKPPPPPPPKPFTTVVDRLLRSRIRAQGPISIGDFMQEVLKSPVGGYYTEAAPATTSGGNDHGVRAACLPPPSQPVECALPLSACVCVCMRVRVRACAAQPRCARTLSSYRS
jgi:hypothetical protein